MKQAAFSKSGSSPPKTTAYTKSGSSPPKSKCRNGHAPEWEWMRSPRYRAGGTWRCLTCWRAYERSPRGRARYATYIRSERGRIAQAKSNWRRKGHRNADGSPFKWADYLALLKSQRGRCALCRALPARRRLDADHDHGSGIVRGLLCNPCNQRLGTYEQGRQSKDEAWNRAALLYLTAAFTAAIGGRFYPAASLPRRKKGGVAA